MVFDIAQKRVDYPALRLNNVVIERVSQFNFVGVILNSRLKWDKHIEHISLKISRVSGVLFWLKHISYKFCTDHRLHLLKKRS